MHKIFSSESFGFLLTLFAFYSASIISEKSRGVLKLFLNPILVATLFIILFLKIFDIPYENYRSGASHLMFFLGPVVVSLGMPLYNRRKKILKNILPIATGIIVGSFVAIVSVILIGRAFGLTELSILSLCPKATTTAIGVEISMQIGGLAPVTIACITIAGITGATLGEHILDIFRIKDASARGIALGTASHVFGTNKALSMGEEEGAMSSLAIGLAGIAAALMMPYVLSLFSL